jgi:ABC-type transport system involved in cytochrome bd biosynthesis fused ATPase/permease subunit/CRP-like cAMP-binding protein
MGTLSAVIEAVRPFVMRSRAALAATLVLVVIGVAAGAYIPQVVKGLLYKPTGGLVVAFVVLLVADPVLNHLAHLRAARLSLGAGYDLRNRVFAGVETTSPLDADPSTRAGAQASTGPDVDRVEHGFEQLIIGAIPGALRIVAALWFLSRISVAGALLMACIVPLFLIVETRLSGRLVAADQARHDGAEHLSTLVDESVSAVTTVRSLPVGTWFRQRFAHQAHHLDELSYQQLRLEARLHLGTRVVALLGLAAVTVFGVRSGSNAATLVAALLYVELAIIGVESLPAAARALQQGEASWTRLKPIVDGNESTTSSSVPADETIKATREPATEPANRSEALVLEHRDGTRVVVPSGSWVAVVTTGDDDPSVWLCGAVAPAHGRVLTGGVDAQLAARSGRITGVPATAQCVDASVMDHLRAVQPDMDHAEALRLLERMGLTQLSDLPDGGLNTPLGVHGAVLSIDERHRLLLAMAVATAPAVLVTGRLRPLTDPDVARTVIPQLRHAINAADAMDAPVTTLLTVVDSADLAQEADLVLFVDGDSWNMALHHDLLMEVPAYVERWGRPTADIDELGVFADAGPLEREVLRSRMITERYEAGNLIYREGAPADRVVFIVSGQVEIVTGAGTDHERRLAVLGAGNAVGDLRLTGDQRRAETARAVDVVVVRTIGLAVWEAGTNGLLRTNPTERRVLAAVLKRGGVTAEDMALELPDTDRTTVDAAIAELLREGALRQRRSGQLVVGTTTRRAIRSTTVLDMLEKLESS